MSLHSRLEALRPALAAAAQAVIDEWEQDDEGVDEEFGEGGACDAVANAMRDVLRNIDTMDGGQDGDDHAYLIAYDDIDAFAVDIPPGVYERGGGYRWRKIPDVQISADDVAIDPVNRSDIEPGMYENGRKDPFVKRIENAASWLPSSAWYGRKVFLAPLAHEMNVPMEEFERTVIRMHQAGVIELSRADMVQAMDPRLVRASEVHPPGMSDVTYHFWNATSGAKPMTPNPRERAPAMQLGAHGDAANRERDASGGRFRRSPPCDFCGKSCAAEHFTDERAIGSGDGPGFYLCGRSTCTRARDKLERDQGFEALKQAYAEQRRKNDAASRGAAKPFMDGPKGTERELEKLRKEQRIVVNMLGRTTEIEKVESLQRKELDLQRRIDRLVFGGEQVPNGNISFEQAKQRRDDITRELDRWTAVQNSFPRGKMGLVSDSARVLPEYREARANTDRLFRELQNFNIWFVKEFKTELAEERRIKRSGGFKPNHAAVHYEDEHVPNARHSVHPTVVQYAVQEMFKGKSPAVAARNTATRLNGGQNMFIDTQSDTDIDPAELEEALWINMAEYASKGVRSGQERGHAQGALTHFGQWSWGKPPKTKMEDKIIAYMARGHTLNHSAVHYDLSQLDDDIDAALDHMSDFEVSLNKSNITVTDPMMIPMSNLGQYDDLSSWLELDSGADAQDIKSFRGVVWAGRAEQWGSPEQMPPIVIVEAPNAVAIADGRGRVNYAMAMGWDEIPAVIVTPALTENHAAVHYVWLVDYRGVPLDTEGPYGPMSLDRAEAFARIGATKGEHDRVVSLGRDIMSDGFEILRRYRRGTGERTQ